MSSEHPTPQAPAEPFDPARMNAQTARLMASDMAALAGAMFRLLQPQAVARPAEAASAPQPPVAAPTAPVTQAPAAPAPALAVPGIAAPALDLQPPADDVRPVEPTPGYAVPAIAVPGLAVPGIQPPRGEPTLAEFDLDPELATERKDDVDEAADGAEEPAASGADESEAASPRSQALMNEIAFLDD